MENMKQLVKKLNEAARNYYSELEVTKMSDREYDMLYDKLVAMEKESGVVLPDSPTLRVGYVVVSGLKKAEHKYPALSLDKTKDPAVLVKWADGKETVLSWKEDGLTLVASYQDGKLVSAVTRGNGYIGEDVMHNAPYIAGLPLEIPYKKELVVRGEVLISYEDFEKTDGLVLAYRDRKYGLSLGTTGKFPKHSIAFKWEDDAKETTLKEIEWSASRTGLINPVAIFEPVDLEGTVVKRASIHNLRYLQDLRLGYGDTITVYKANMIIPQIAENLTQNGNLIKIPEVCPVCGKPTEKRLGKDTEALYCTNPDCAAKHVGKYVRMAERDALNVVGMSKAAIEKFVERGFLTQLSDLYHLEEHKEEIMDMDGFGEKSYEKMIQAIESSQKTTFKQFFYALGIPGIGHDVAKILEKHFNKENGKTKTDLLYDLGMKENAISELTALEGIGLTTATTLFDWIREHSKEYFSLRKELDIIDDNITTSSVTKQDLAGKTFVITGSLETYANRNELKKEIEERGGKVSGSVSKKTSYLISNEDSSSSKSVKAKELGVKIITETEYKSLR